MDMEKCDGGCGAMSPNEEGIWEGNHWCTIVFNGNKYRVCKKCLGLESYEYRVYGGDRNAFQNVVKWLRDRFGKKEIIAELEKEDVLGILEVRGKTDRQVYDRYGRSPMSRFLIRIVELETSLKGKDSIIAELEEAFDYVEREKEAWRKKCAELEEKNARLKDGIEQEAADYWGNDGGPFLQDEDKSQVGDWERPFFRVEDCLPKDGQDVWCYGERWENTEPVLSTYEAQHGYFNEYHNKCADGYAEVTHWQPVH